MIGNWLREFLRLEAAGGIVLVVAAAVALALANSPLGPLYESFRSLPCAVRIGPFELDKPLLWWVNDLWMAVFFFLVGLEIKREFLEGELSSRAQAMMPIIGALGGMAAPAAIYTLINIASPANLGGWAIPTATDIAFTLGVVALLGSRVPFPLKVLVAAIAVIDDLGAIVIIAAFYTADLSWTSLALAVLAVLALTVLNLMRVGKIAAYVAMGAVLWLCVLKSGVHSTLAGVITAFAVPLGVEDDQGRGLLKRTEEALHPWVAYLILPMFAFANSGVPFSGMGAEALLEPVTAGIALGLFVGKQIGVFTPLWLAIRSGLVPMPQGATLAQLYGVCVLCGIGFTMSLFIGGLAFATLEYAAEVRLGVLGGSLLSAAVGYALLRRCRPVADG